MSKYANEIFIPSAPAQCKATAALNEQIEADLEQEGGGEPTGEELFEQAE